MYIWTYIRGHAYKTKYASCSAMKVPDRELAPDQGAFPRYDAEDIFYFYFLLLARSGGRETPAFTGRQSWVQQTGRGCYM